MTERCNWVDIAKGVSISLVVFWHVVGDAIYVNEALIFLRMPLFFFLAGLFSGKSMRMAWPSFLSIKIGSMLYLYITWVFLTFLLVTVATGLFRGQPVDWWAPFTLFTNPPQTLWFIYALAISYLAARATFRLPWFLVLSVAMIAYFFSVSSGDWRGLPFYERVIRLFPFFLLGMRAFDLIDAVRANYAWVGIPVLGLFLAVSVWLYGSSYSSWGILTLAVSLAGIFSLCLTSAVISATRAGDWLVWVGQSSLYIYIMHRIALAYAEFVLARVGLSEGHPIILVGLSLFIIAVTAVAGRLLAAHRYGRWLFTAPWIAPKRSSVKTTGAVVAENS